MISNQILQSTLEGLKAISRVDFAVIDTDGNAVVATTSLEGNYQAKVVDFVRSAADSQEVSRYQYFKIYDEATVEYVLIAIGSGEDVYMVGKMACFQIQNLMVAYKERFDKDNFIKNLLLDNLLLVDIYSRSKKLRIKMEAVRCVMIVETRDHKECNTVEAIREYIMAASQDFVTAVDENSVIIVKELAVPADQVKAEMDKAAKAVIAGLEKEGAQRIHVAYGTTVNELKEVSRSYKEAKMALEVGKIFFEEKKLISYTTLGIGRLIYQLPMPLCKMFIREIFGTERPEEFDEETMITIQKFFENSLNVSETSRQLFIHRNTLVYRLDKLQKSTGLDLRVFEDAITFKIAMMVVRYMKYMEQIEY
ncbi:MAG: helix-turn-helix domain-containing protein [Lachnospiraceae bacterium]|nr:helix-turn-helix domain-containing protein [Lachnospiraceae bacterium]